MQAEAGNTFQMYGSLWKSRPTIYVLNMTDARRTEAVAPVKKVKAQMAARISSVSTQRLRITRRSLDTMNISPKYNMLTCVPDTARTCIDPVSA
jgi:hypothetical protein